MLWINLYALATFAPHVNPHRDSLNGWQKRGEEREGKVHQHQYLQEWHNVLHDARKFDESFAVRADLETQHQNSAHLREQGDHKA